MNKIKKGYVIAGTIKAFNKQTDRVDEILVLYNKKTDYFSLVTTNNPNPICYGDMREYYSDNFESESSVYRKQVHNILLSHRRNLQIESLLV